MLRFKSGEIVNERGIENMSAVKICVASANSRIVCVSETGRRIHVSERRVRKILRPRVARLELRVARQTRLERRLERVIDGIAPVVPLNQGLFGKRAEREERRAVGAVGQDSVFNERQSI